MSPPAPADPNTMDRPPSGTGRPPIHTVLPPLILGTATFNTQYVASPLTMPSTAIITQALALGLHAFDTSPYYGPSELLLGAALSSLSPPPPRSSLFLITKCGRLTPTQFDYTPPHIRYSILRSLKRLHTPYLDLVYTHDAEFLSAREVLTAVRELRRLRDEEHLLRYVGISGFPPLRLAELAELVLAETGEPLDAVLSYGHFTVQNCGLVSGGALERLKGAGVGVVLNASVLGMGLLTSRGIPADREDGTSPLAGWHPSPPGLRTVCKGLAGMAEKAGERLEGVAIRWAMEEWAREGAGTGVDVMVPGEALPRRVGGTVCGVSSVAELDETVKEWREVMAGLGPVAPEGALERREKVGRLVRDEFWPALGEWKDYAWASPEDGFVNQRKPEEMGTVPDDGIVSAHELRIQLNG
ncbi:Aldo/keto reductase family-domain-containing protein [Schizothecium vesticola]|uniref:Aldo/keto reductase family-domain-containing protein n=1 Tax=Schizothecium vesticola TaxID=314040 RepID=A0AA40EP77_9PEZI|nr:Aldo/keto reductase family-domain-containing protein [Schizothecium vesticola]